MSSFSGQSKSSGGKSRFWGESAGSRGSSRSGGHRTANLASVRNRVRLALAGVLILAAAAGVVDEPRLWNRAAGAVNAVFARGGFLKKLHIPDNFKSPFHLGLDLRGGTHLVYDADVRNLPAGDRAGALDGARDVIERRVNAYGVAEPLVQTVKTGEAWRIIVELAGVRDTNEAIRMIGETPILEFKEERAESAGLSADEQKNLNDYNAAARERASEAFAKALAPGADFSALVKDISEESAKDNAGDIGWIGLGHGFDDLTMALDNARAASGTLVRKLIETPDGFNIIRVTGVRDGGRFIKASHILVCYHGAEQCGRDTPKDKAREEAANLRREATPANFASLARANSTEPGAAQTAGNLGWFQPGMMVPEFDKAVLAQRVGTISPVVETKYGFHIIYKTADKPAQKEYLVQRIFIAKKTAASLTAADRWKSTGLSGKQLTRAQLEFDQTSSEPLVGLQFNDEGKNLFSDITGRNIGKYVAIFLDGQPISIPRVNEQITGGQAVITGNFSIPEAKKLAQRLNAGALPVPITLVSQNTVGASLGAASVQKSLLAGLVGFILVALFMILYYRLPGVVATLALVIYGLIILALFKLIPVTLTLSGIAGFILSLGMAVDANVLIFERTREELRAGKTLGAAIDEGFVRAWSSIRDGNLTTLISVAILFWFSESLIKGFALTLGIGVMLSMFSAISVTRVMLKFLSPYVKSPWLFGAKPSVK